MTSSRSTRARTPRRLRSSASSRPRLRPRPSLPSRAPNRRSTEIRARLLFRVCDARSRSRPPRASSTTTSPSDDRSSNVHRHLRRRRLHRHRPAASTTRARTRRTNTVACPRATPRRRAASSTSSCDVPRFDRTNERTNERTNDSTRQNPRRHS